MSEAVHPFIDSPKSLASYSQDEGRQDHRDESDRKDRRDSRDSRDRRDSKDRKDKIDSRDKNDERDKRDRRDRRDSQDRRDRRHDRDRRERRDRRDERDRRHYRDRRHSASSAITIISGHSDESFNMKKSPKKSQILKDSSEPKKLKNSKSTEEWIMVRKKVDSLDYGQPVSQKGLSTFKAILFICSIAVWLSGCCFKAVACFTFLEFPFMAPYISKFESYMILGGFGVAGLLAFFISFLGFIAALSSSKRLLRTYVVMSIIVLTIILAGLGVAWVMGIRTEGESITNMKKEMAKYEPNKSPFAPGPNMDWDTMQTAFKCCGILQHHDWIINNVAFQQERRVPNSCCVDSTIIIEFPIIGCTHKPYKDTIINPVGCYEATSGYLKNFFPIIGSSMIGFAVFMIFGLLFGILACVKTK